MRCLAFDLGRVVFDFDYRRALSRLQGKIKSPDDEVIHELFHRDFATDFERGLVSSYDFYNKFKNRFGSDLSYDEFKDIWSRIFTPKQDTINLIKALRRIYPVYLISNINELHFRHLYDEFGDVFSLFDGMVLSFQVKEVKPAPAIYEELRRLCGSRYEEIVYIDDRPELVEASRRLRIKGITYFSHARLLDELSQEGIVIPLPSEVEVFDKLHSILQEKEKPVVVGIGNRMRSDDYAGSAVAAAIKSNVSVEVIDAQHTLENHLDKIKSARPDLVLFIDASPLTGESRIGLFSPSQLAGRHLGFTHNTSLKTAIQYLQEYPPLDILILGIKGNKFDIGETMTEETAVIVEAVASFFARHFPKKERVAQ